MEPIIGIDLGTTNSVVAYTNSDSVTTVIAAKEDGARIIPSAVYFPGDGAVPIVGEIAKKQAVVTPDRVAMLFKRGMGDQTFLPDGKEFVVDGKTYPPEELSGFVLGRLKKIAEDHFGETVSKAIITVPAYFGDVERFATRKAGDLAGLEVLQVLNEPTAAALAHGLGQETADGHILVFDLGGGTFDVTVMISKKEETEPLKALSSTGDRRLGGTDFDNLVLEEMVSQGVARTGANLTDDPHDHSDALRQAEEIKKELSTLPSASARLIIGGQSDVFTLTKEQFGQMLDDRYMQNIEDHVVNAIEDAGLTAEDITTVLMVGGSSRIPAFRDLLKRVCGKDPVFSTNLDEDVARGASMLAVMREASQDPTSELTGLLKDLPIPVDAATWGLGTSVHPDGKQINYVMIEPGTPLPASSEQTFVTMSEGQTRVEVDLNEGNETDMMYVKQLAVAVGEFGRGVRKGYPVKVSIRYEVDQQIKVEAHDGETGAFLCELDYKYDHLISEDQEEQARAEIRKMMEG